MIKTVLKWAGSKARLSAKLREYLPEGDRLVEPFGGSCAVMMNTDYPEYLVADVNLDLINLYQVIQEDAQGFIDSAQALFMTANTPEQYLEFRQVFNHTCADRFRRAVIFLYLNRHCFNGLCRYNRAGFFNVPYGKYKAPYFPEEEIRAFAEKAKRATFICATFTKPCAWCVLVTWCTAIRPICLRKAKTHSQITTLESLESVST